MEVQKIGHRAIMEAVEQIAQRPADDASPMAMAGSWRAWWW